MGEKINYNEIKVVVMNPERIPFMEEKLTTLLYKEYIKEHNINEVVNEEEK